MKFAAFPPIDLKNSIENIGMMTLALSKVVPDTNQPRKNFNQKSLSELAASIQKHGVIQPIIVKKYHNDQYQIIAGERRWRASQMAGLQTIPVIVQGDDVKENKAIALIENIQREELNPIELAESFHQLSTDYHLSHEAIAMMVGKSRATVTNLLRLLNLASDVRKLVADGKLEMGHARALLTLPDDQQSEFAVKTIEKNLTVRETEKLVQSKKNTIVKTGYNPYKERENYLIKNLSKKTPLKFSANINMNGAGRVTIYFASPDEIERFVEALE